jgi:type I restriction enzyme S subunit
MDLRFLVWLLASPLIYNQATRSTTGTAQPTIALRPLRNFTAPVPPLAEQHRIVAKLDELMALCDRLEANLTTADDTRRRLLEALLAEALSPALTIDREAAE